MLEQKKIKIILIYNEMKSHKSVLSTLKDTLKIIIIFDVVLIV